jgi:hypothetical protein
MYYCNLFLNQFLNIKKGVVLKTTPFLMYMYLKKIFIVKKVYMYWKYII